MPKFNKALGIPEENALPTGEGAESVEDYMQRMASQHDEGALPSALSSQDIANERARLEEIYKLNPSHMIDTERAASLKEKKKRNRMVERVREDARRK